MQEISRGLLADKLQGAPSLCVIDVLPAQEFAESHLPGALNVPLDGDFDRRVQRMVPDRNRPIVVYCKNRACSASPRAAHRLEKLGYRHVLDYAAGKEDWLAAGLATVSTPPRRAH